MTKVIEHGNFVGRRVRCLACRCVFEIEAGDVPGDVLEGDHGVVNVTFECPECTRHSPLSIHDEPDDVVRYSDLRRAYDKVFRA